MLVADGPCYVNHELTLQSHPFTHPTNQFPPKYERIMTFSLTLPIHTSVTFLIPPFFPDDVTIKAVNDDDAVRNSYRDVIMKRRAVP